MSSNHNGMSLGVVKQVVVRITSRFQEKSLFSCLLVHEWWFQNLIELQDVIQEPKGGNMSNLIIGFSFQWNLHVVPSLGKDMQGMCLRGGRCRGIFTLKRPLHHRWVILIFTSMTGKLL